MSEKLERLRSFVQALQILPLDVPWDEATWQKKLEDSDLTPEEVRQLFLLRRGHIERGERAQGWGDWETAVEEWRQALSFGPGDFEFEKTLQEVLQGNERAEVKDFLRLLSRRSRTSNKKRRLSVPLAGLLAFGGAIALSLFWIFPVFHPFDPSTAFQRAGSKEQSQDLKLTVDTLGYTCEITTVHCRLVTYPEARVVEALASFRFPDQGIGHWEAEVVVLDSDKKQLDSRVVTLRGNADGPLQAGQSMDFFQQFDAQSWTGRPAEVFVKTTRLDVVTEIPVGAKSVELLGSLPDGFHVSGKLLRSSWRSLFAKQVQDLDLEISNTGLKSISDLSVTAIWRGPDNEVWKTMQQPVVSPARSPLVSGGKVSVHWEAEFPIEIFPLSAGSPNVEFHISTESNP